MAPRRSITALAVALPAALLLACGSGGGDAGTSSEAGPTAVATTTQVADLARQVAGDRADVRQILQPNSDPHDYEPRPSDVEAVSGADVVLRSGGDLDDWLDDVLKNAGSDAQAATLIDVVRTREGEGHGHDEAAHDEDEDDHDDEAAHEDDEDGHDDEDDPHWWHDPRNAIAAVGAIRDALVRADPDGRDTYVRNAARYAAELRALDRSIASCIAKVPERQRKLVTDHDALGYYADRYDVEVVGTVVPALSTQAQSSAGEVARLVRTIRAENVTTIFPESSVNPRLARAIARDAGAKVGPALYADTLGERGTEGATYVGSLKANTRALVDGFTGGRVSCRL